MLFIIVFDIDCYLYIDCYLLDRVQTIVSRNLVHTVNHA